TFITLLKSNNYSISEIIQKNNKQNLSFLKERNELFIEIIKPIFQLYENFLKRENELDFNDLINKATNYINQGMLKDVYKYIIIDEFQDISIGRYNLLKALKKQNPNCNFFCVGDDWQSIYRFTGSDIALFKDFH